MVHHCIPLRGNSPARHPVRQPLGAAVAQSAPKSSRSTRFQQAHNTGQAATTLARTAMKFQPSDGLAPKANILVKTPAGKTINLDPTLAARSTPRCNLQEFADVTYTISGEAITSNEVPQSCKHLQSSKIDQLCSKEIPSAGEIR